MKVGRGISLETRFNRFNNNNKLGILCKHLTSNNVPPVQKYFLISIAYFKVIDFCQKILIKFLTNVNGNSKIISISFEAY